MLLVWGIAFGCMKRIIVRVELAQKTSPTVSDFSVVVERMPTDLKIHDIQR